MTVSVPLLSKGEGLKGQGPRRSTIFSVVGIGTSSLQSVTLRRDTFRDLAVVAHCMHSRDHCTFFNLLIYVFNLFF